MRAVYGVLAGIFLIFHSAGASAIGAVPAGFADLVEKLQPAVVNISTTQNVKSGGVKFNFKGLPPGQGMEQFRDFFEQFGGRFGVPEEEEQSHKVTSLGSGFIIDPAGFIVTNQHVVAEAQDITVTLHDDTKYPAKVVGRDPKTDLALIKVESKKPLPFVSFGDSDQSRVGDWVIAIGNPYGLGGSVSAGIVSARSRNINAGPFDDFIQTDAAINRGNSGGPLFNEAGEVIGVNSAIFSPSGGNIGIGFAIPSSLAKPVMMQLKQFGRTHRGWLGVKIQYVSDEIADSVGLAKQKGALVLEVNDGSPAQKAGIQAGDVILSFDGKDISEMRFLPRMVAETKIGKSCDVEIWRDGKKRDVSIVLGELEEDEKQADAASKPTQSSDSSSPAQNFMGLSLAELNAQARKQFGLRPDVSGLLVLKTNPTEMPDGAVALQPRDVIVQANQVAIHTVTEIKRAAAQAKKQGKKYMLLRILRGKAQLFVTLPLTEK